MQNVDNAKKSKPTCHTGSAAVHHPYWDPVPSERAVALHGANPEN